MGRYRSAATCQARRREPRYEAKTNTLTGLETPRYMGNGRATVRVSNQREQKNTSLIEYVFIMYTCHAFDPFDIDIPITDQCSKTS